MICTHLFKHKWQKSAQRCINLLHLRSSSMPTAPRPNKKAMELAYSLLEYPEENKQNGKKKPSKAILDEWSKDVPKARV